MIGLRDLDNAEQVNPPGYAVDLQDLVVDEIEFGKRQDKAIKISYRGQPLVVNVPVSVVVTLKPPLTCVYIRTPERLGVELAKCIYSRLGQTQAIKEMIPKPGMSFGLSRLDQAGLGGFLVGYTRADLKQSVRCVTDQTNLSTSISCGIEYPATWTVDMSKLIFDGDRVPEESDEDFFVCLATPTVCLTLNSPQANYGRFSRE